MTCLRVRQSGQSGQLGAGVIGRRVCGRRGADVGRALERAVLAASGRRTVLRCAMPGMASVEAVGWIRHRFGFAGRSGWLFTGDAVTVIHTPSCGFPRAVDRLCLRSLVAAFAARQVPCRPWPVGAGAGAGRVGWWRGGPGWVCAWELTSLAARSGGRVVSPEGGVFEFLVHRSAAVRGLRRPLHLRREHHRDRYRVLPACRPAGTGQRGPRESRRADRGCTIDF